MSHTVTIREILESDLPLLFEFQCDPEANYRADFPPREEAKFFEHWAKILVNPDSFHQAILSDGEVVGNINRFTRDGEIQIGYWVARSHWGRGIGSRAVNQFLELDPVRPLLAYVVEDNLASKRILEKNGFVTIGEFEEPALYRQGTVAMWKMKLESKP